MAIIEYNEIQGRFHIQYGNRKENEGRWMTIAKGVPETLAHKFCNEMNDKFPSTIGTNSETTTYPSFKTIDIEFVAWWLMENLEKINCHFIQIEYDETVGRFHFQPENTAEIKNELIVNKISKVQCFEFLSFYIHSGSPPKKRNPTAWYSNEVKQIFQNFLLSPPKPRKRKQK